MVKKKYKVGDIVYLKKKAAPRRDFPDLDKKTKFLITAVDNDEVPYHVEFNSGDEIEGYWICTNEVRCLASNIFIGGE